MRPLNWRRKPITYVHEQWADPAVKRWYPILMHVTCMLGLSVMLSLLLLPLINYLPVGSGKAMLLLTTAAGILLGNKIASKCINKRCFPYGRYTHQLGNPK